MPLKHRGLCGLLGFYFLSILIFFSRSAGSVSSSPSVPVVSAAVVAEAPIDLSRWTLEEKVGQLFMVGFRNFEQLNRLKPGGVVFFSWNLGSLDESRSLVNRVKAVGVQKLKAPLFLATDQEGGMVTRLREGFTPFPDAGAVGAVGDPFLAFRVGRVMGVEMAAMGLNMNFAPVLDLGNARSFLGNRVWGDRAAQITQSTLAFIDGLQASGIIPVAKHFPGHGGTRIDSHRALPQVSKSFEELWKEDLLPFQEASRRGVPALMTAHVEMPKIDRGPASLSPVFLHDILRQKMQFKGLIISDDLEMRGALAGSTMSEEELALKALKSGSDMILIVWSQEAQQKVLHHLVNAIKKGLWEMADLDSKVRRIVATKQKFLGQKKQILEENPYWKENLRLPASLLLAKEVAQRALQWRAGPEPQIREMFAKRWGSAWKVFYSGRATHEMWKKFRPQDQLVALPSSGKSRTPQILAQIKQSLESNEPMVLVTPPRTLLDSDFFDELRRLLSRRLKQQIGPQPLLWVHQGPSPLVIQGDPDRLPMGIVALHSSSALSLEMFQDSLRPRL